MKCRTLVLLLAVMSPSLALAFDCSSALVTYDRAVREKDAITLEISNLSKKKKLAESDFNHVYDDLRNDLAQVDRDIAKKRVDFEKSIQDRRVIGEEYDQTARELKAGLYCSKCNRSRSEIERAEKKPFSKHLEDVKGVRKSASAEVLREAFEEYKRQREKSYQKSVAIEKDIERLEKKMPGLKRSAETKRDSLRYQQERIESEIRERVIVGNQIMSEFNLQERVVKENGCGL